MRPLISPRIRDLPFDDVEFAVGDEEGVVELRTSAWQNSARLGDVSLWARLDVRSGALTTGYYFVQIARFDEAALWPMPGSMRARHRGHSPRSRPAAQLLWTFGSREQAEQVYAATREPRA